MLTREILEQTRRLHIRTRRLVDGVFAGQYHSVFKGRGMEFADVREYEPGDDVRSIDWNVTARTGQPFVKRYVEERELTVMLLVDVSASGRFGTRDKPKVQVATELCAVLARSALANNDKVGLVLFTDRVERYVPPQKGRQRSMRVISEMLSAAPRRTGTDIALALRFLNKVCRRRTVSFLVSDFIDADYESSLRLVHRRHDVIPVCVRDEREQSLPDVGLMRFEDLETGRQMLVDTSAVHVREVFADVAQKKLRQRERAFRSMGLDIVDVGIDGDYVHALMRFFRHRERRLMEGR
ncbi:MAG: DUF58 domain-containing protein [Gammaproteobacteria bacterium]